MSPTSLVQPLSISLSLSACVCVFFFTSLGLLAGNVFAFTQPHGALSSISLSGPPCDSTGLAAAPSPYGAPARGAPPPMYGQQPGYSPYGPPPTQQPQQGYSPYGQIATPYGADPHGVKTEKIVIPSVCAGTVIGKGGSIIAEIKSQSGCQVSIATAEPTAPQDRVVSITGSSQGINAAIQLIRQRVESYQPPSHMGQQQPPHDQMQPQY